jgi:hypothetical protein
VKFGLYPGMNTERHERGEGLPRRFLVAERVNGKRGKALYPEKAQRSEVTKEVDGRRGVLYGGSRCSLVYGPAWGCETYNGLRDRIATRSSLEWHPFRLFLPSVL